MARDSDDIRRHIQVLKELIKSAEIAENCMSMAKHGETLLKAMKALRDQEEYERETLRRSDYAKVAKILGTVMAQEILDRIGDREQARSIVNDALVKFKDTLEKEDLI